MLDARLRECLHCMDGCSVLYDVGSDHAYLPTAAIKEGMIEKAYAVDNKEGPLDNARVTIESNEAQASIELKLSSGLDDLQDDVDCVSIAGVGGKTIYDIMRHSDFKAVKRFIFQPSAHPQKVRQLVNMRALKITRESVVALKGELYPIIVMERGTQTLDDTDLYIGPILRHSPPEIYKRHLADEHAFLSTLIDSIPSEDAKVPLKEKKQLLERVFDEWQSD